LSPFPGKRTQGRRVAFRRLRHSQTSAGFGLIEFSVVIGILGIVFLMALKGTAIVTSIRALVVARELDQFVQKVDVYRSQNSGALPGDDKRGPERYGRPKALSIFGEVYADAAGDGKIQGRLTDFRNPDSEQFMAWRDLRYAGLIDGDPSIPGFSSMPEHTFGGNFGFDEGNLGQTEPGSLCATRVPGEAARQIDERLDDGVVDKGRLVATSQYVPTGVYNHFDAPDSEPYNIEKEYIICIPMVP